MKTLLARLCANRFITYSPDGVLHLTWRHFTLHMMGMDLLQVVRFLESINLESIKQESIDEESINEESIRGQVAPGFTYGDSHCTVNWGQANRLELWLFGVGFALQPEELAELLILSKAAVEHFKTIENDPIRFLIDAEFPTCPEIVLSLN